MAVQNSFYQASMITPHSYVCTFLRIHPTVLLIPLDFEESRNKFPRLYALFLLANNATEAHPEPAMVFQPKRGQQS